MSANSPKADIDEGFAECPLMTRSGHSGMYVVKAIITLFIQGQNVDP